MATFPQLPRFLEANLAGTPRPDGMVKRIADFLFHFIQNTPQEHRDQLEVEVKFGLVIDKSTGVRLNLPILNEAALADVPEHFRFQPGLTLDQHRYYNEWLNARVNECAQESHRGSKVYYKHTRLEDAFYQDNRADKVRVSRDTATQEVVACIQKRTLAHLNIHMPSMPLDCRVSVSLEVPVQLPPAHVPSTMTRCKDRLSYRHQIWRMDLTQVRTDKGEVLHELEMEVNDLKPLVLEADKAGRNQVPNDFLGIVQVLTNNMRLLASKVASQ